MTLKKPLLISFVGPSGSGKTTASKMAIEKLKECGFYCHRMDVARPLREVQAFAYEKFGRPSPGDPNKPETFLQDGKLLGFLASHFGSSLQAAFKKRFCEEETTLQQVAYINADCRNNSYQCLKSLGFLFIRLDSWPAARAVRLKRRDGYDSGLDAPRVDRTDKIKDDYLINNDETLSELKDKIVEVVTDIITKYI